MNNIIGAASIVSEERNPSEEEKEDRILDELHRTFDAVPSIPLPKVTFLKFLNSIAILKFKFL